MQQIFTHNTNSFIIIFDYLKLGFSEILQWSLQRSAKVLLERRLISVESINIITWQRFAVYFQLYTLFNILYLAVISMSENLCILFLIIYL